MVWQYHWLNGQEFEQTPGDGEEQGSLACCSPQGNKESDMAEWLNNKKVCHSFPCKEQASFDFIAAVTICSDLGAKENKICYCFHSSPHSICHEVKGPDAVILVFWMLSFKPAFSLSSFTLIKRLFSSSLLSAFRVVSSAYQRLLIFLPAILIPAVFPPVQRFSVQSLSIQNWFPLGSTILISLLSKEL